MILTTGLVELFGPGDCNARFVLDYATLKRLVLAAKVESEHQMDQILDNTEYRLQLATWTMADNLHTWLDELPQPGDEEAE